MTTVLTAVAEHPGTATTFLAATDLVSGSRALYNIVVAILVIAILLGAGFRTVGAFAGGRMGSAVGWALVGIVVAVLIGSSYALYVSTKQTVDQTGITTGQFGS